MTWLSEIEEKVIPKQFVLREPMERMARAIRELAKYAKFLEAYVESDILQTERRAANLSPDAKEVIDELAERG